MWYNHSEGSVGKAHTVGEETWPGLQRHLPRECMSKGQWVEKADTLAQVGSAERFLRVGENPERNTGYRDLEILKGSRVVRSDGHKITEHHPIPSLIV